MHYPRTYIPFLAIVVSLAFLLPAQAVNDFGAASPLESMQRQMGAATAPFLTSGCAPSVPASSLTLAAFACTGFVWDTQSPPRLLPVIQAAQSLTLPATTGTYWLALHRQTAGAVAGGWTRIPEAAGGSHYLYLQSATTPTPPGQGLLFAKVTVAGGVITAVADLRTGNGSRQGANCLDPLWGVVADGVTDAQPGLQRAINMLHARGGGQLFCPAGDYLLATPLLIPHTDVELEQGITLVGETPGATRLLAGNNGITVVHFSGSHGGVRHLTLDGNGKTGVSGLRMTPEDEAQTTTRVDQNYNLFEDLHIEDADEGIVMQCGPDVGGADSGCWYNTVHRVHIQRTVRGVWLKNCPNTSCAGVNGNMFNAVRVGQSPANTCLQIDSGSTNEFHKLDCEGIGAGTSPQSTPTAIVIALAGTFSGDNNSNKFFGGRHEETTRSFVNHNPSTEFYGVSFAPAGVTASFAASTVLPMMMLGGDQDSNIPTILKSLSRQGNSQMNALQTQSNNTWEYSSDVVLRGWRLYDYVTATSLTQGAGKWATYSLPLASTTNIAALGTVVQYAQQIGGMVDWHLRMEFQATLGAQAITVLFPIRPADAPNRTSMAPMHWPLVVYDGVNPPVPSLGQLQGGGDPFNLTIPAPAGGWHTGGTNNQLHLTIRYMSHPY